MTLAERGREGAVWFTLAALPLSTAALELGCAVLLVLALIDGRAWRFLELPWASAGLVVLGVGALGALASGGLSAGLGWGWALAPLVGLAALPNAPEWVERRCRVGLAAAAVASVMALSQRVAGLDPRGTQSHHLTLAYALVPPFAVAVARRNWTLAGLLGLGVLASGSDAAPVAVVVAALVAAGAGAFWSFAGGAVATLAGLAWLAGASELGQRAVLWTGGLLLAPGHAGAGGYRVASAPAYDALQPGFWFPNHAHDSYIQVAATLGAAGWIALLALVTVIWRFGARGAVAGLAGVLVGGLTQDTLGDLEVARAAFVWVAVLGVSLPAISGTRWHPDGQASP